MHVCDGFSLHSMDCTLPCLTCLIQFAREQHLIPLHSVTGVCCRDDRWNWLDAFIIAVSLVDFIISMAGSGSGTALSVIRIVRILRIVRLISFMEKMAYLVSAFVKGMESVCWVLLLWVPIRVGVVVQVSAG